MLTAGRGGDKYQETRVFTIVMPVPAGGQSMAIREAARQVERGIGKLIGERAAGLPVITTAQNGFSEIIEAGVEGEVVQRADDISGLTAALRNWEDPARRVLVYPRLMELGEQFSIEANVKKTLSLISKAI